jgi:hypothetical protein
MYIVLQLTFKLLYAILILCALKIMKYDLSNDLNFETIHIQKVFYEI